MKDNIIEIQTYLNAMININNDCIASDWYLMIGFNELIKKDSFLSSDKISLFDDVYEKFYTINEVGEKTFIGDYVEILNWREELRKTCDSYFFRGVSSLVCSFARKISNVDFVEIGNKYKEVIKNKKCSTDRFLTLIDKFFKDDFIAVYSKGINSNRIKRIEPLDEFVFVSNKGVFILKFEMGD